MTNYICMCMGNCRGNRWSFSISQSFWQRCNIEDLIRFINAIKEMYLKGKFIHAMMFNCCFYFSGFLSSFFSWVFLNSLIFLIIVDRQICKTFHDNFNHRVFAKQLLQGRHRKKCFFFTFRTSGTHKAMETLK